jgi:hypothetical protein
MKFGIKAALTPCALLTLALLTCLPVMSAELTQTPTPDQITANAKELKSKQKRPLRKRRIRKQQVPARQRDRYDIAAITGSGVTHGCGYFNDPAACAKLEQSRSILWSGCQQGNKNACSYLLKLQDLEISARLMREIR